MTRVIGDELKSVSAALCAKNPAGNSQDMARLVHDVYQELASQARIIAHLIPLTLNVSRRRLADGYLATTATGPYEPLLILHAAPQCLGPTRPTVESRPG